MHSVVLGQLKLRICPTPDTSAGMVAAAVHVHDCVEFEKVPAA
jgi:hypothetical protein